MAKLGDGPEALEDRLGPHRIRYHCSTRSGGNSDAGKVVNTIAYLANSSVSGFGLLPFDTAVSRSFLSEMAIAASDLRIAQTRPATAFDALPGSVAAGQADTAPGRCRFRTSRSRLRRPPSDAFKGRDPVFTRTGTYPPASATWAMPFAVEWPRPPIRQSPSETGNRVNDSPVPVPSVPVRMKWSHSGEERGPSGGPP